MNTNITILSSVYIQSVYVSFKYKVIKSIQTAIYFFNEVTLCDIDISDNIKRIVSLKKLVTTQDTAVLHF